MINVNELFYEEEGLGNEETVIFLHPKILSNWIWEEQKGQLENYDCIYLDLPNHGNSPPMDTFTIKGVCELIKEFILMKIKPSFKKDKVNLVGIGTGGLIAFELLCKYPELLDKIIVTGISSPEDVGFEKRESSIVNIFDNTKKILDNKPKDFLTKAWLANYGFSRRFSKKMKFSYESISQKDLKDISFEALNYRIPEVKDVSKGKDLLIVFGTKDERVVNYSSVLFHSKFPNAKCLKIDKALHMWNLLEPKLFNEIMVDFIKEGNVKIYPQIVEE